MKKNIWENEKNKKITLVLWFEPSDKGQGDIACKNNDDWICSTLMEEKLCIDKMQKVVFLNMWRNLESLRQAETMKRIT